MKDISTTENTKNHNNFSGILTNDDFSTSSPNKKRINTQVVADRLPEYALNKKIMKNKEKEMKSYTLEELRSMKFISNTNGRPDYSLTDEKWQREFEIRKFLVKPTKNRSMGGKFSKESSYWRPEVQGAYYGATNYQEYCAFINDVLKEIRANQVEYIYFIYQIDDLLRFHHDDLRTKYVSDGGNGYWRVWLER